MLYEKIIEIIVYLLNELRNNKQLGEVDLENLTKLGYSANEINTAFSWVYSKIHAGESIFKSEIKGHKSFRILHELEKNVISPEAYGYLIQLHELGLINDSDIEVIIERVMLSSYSKVDAPDMKAYVAAFLLGVDDMTNNNRRIMINTDNTIN